MPTEVYTYDIEGFFVFMKLAVFIFLILLFQQSAQAQRFAFEQRGLIVAIGDIHSDPKAMIDALVAAEVLDGDGKFVAHRNGISDIMLAGDFVDKGPNSLRVWDLLLYLDLYARSHRVNLHIHAGNHDHALLEGNFARMLPEDVERFKKFDSSPEVGVWRALSSEPYSGLMKKMRIMTRVGKYLMVHATPMFDLAERFNLRSLNLLYQKWVAEQIEFIRNSLNGIRSSRPELPSVFASWDFVSPLPRGGVPRSPLWWKGIADADFPLSRLVKAIKHFGGEVALVGHMPTSDGEIKKTHQRHIIRLDTNLSKYLAEEKGGSISALKIFPDRWERKKTPFKELNHVKRGFAREAYKNIVSHLSRVRCESVLFATRR